MTGNQLATWLSVAALLISAAGTIYAWLTSGSRANAEQLKNLFERMAMTERRIERLRGDVDHMPDKDMVQRMEVTMTEVRGQISVLNERLMPLAAISERLQDFLIEQAGK